MNEITDWFPEGDESWGNSSISYGRKMTDKELADYENKRDKEYKSLKLKGKGFGFDLDFLKRAFDEGIEF